MKNVAAILTGKLLYLILEQSYIQYYTSDIADYKNSNLQQIYIIKDQIGFLKNPNTDYLDWVKRLGQSESITI